MAESEAGEIRRASGGTYSIHTTFTPHALFLFWDALQHEKVHVP